MSRSASSAGVRVRRNDREEAFLIKSAQNANYLNEWFVSKNFTQIATKFYAQTLFLSYKTLKSEIGPETVAKIEIGQK